jgi:hypothetical protein
MRDPEFFTMALVPSFNLKKELTKYIKKSEFNMLNYDPNNSSLPLQLKKVIPNASRQFIEWFVGFTDAEGCFYIQPNKTKTSFQLVFHIELHIDDIDVLYKIVEILGVGRVIKIKGRNSAKLYIYKFDDIIKVLIPIFQEFPLQTTKYLDFISFLEIALIKNLSSSSKRSLKISESDIMNIKKLKENMNSGRSIINKEQEELLKNKISLNVGWLIGFIEGEGTFGYKHLVPYFQVAQHKKNLFVLEAIETYLLNLFEKYFGSASNFKVKVTYTLNKGTGVYSMTITSIDTIYEYLIPLFESMPFYTRKNLDYLYWVLSVIIHKFGYYYLPEGKKIALQISSGTNKYRYSSNKAHLSQIELPSNESISKLLLQTAPFDVNSGRSHLDLAKELTISKGGRKGFTVYIYVQDSSLNIRSGFKELKGSPFSTYGAGHEAIGIKRNSRVIGRYIDTGKVYKDKYIFSSIPTRF